MQSLNSNSPWACSGYSTPNKILLFLSEMLVNVVAFVPFCVLNAVVNRDVFFVLVTVQTTKQLSNFFLRIVILIKQIKARVNHTTYVDRC